MFKSSNQYRAVFIQPINISVFVENFKADGQEYSAAVLSVATSAFVAVIYKLMAICKRLCILQLQARVAC